MIDNSACLLLGVWPPLCWLQMTSPEQDGRAGIQNVWTSFEEVKTFNWVSAPSSEPLLEQVVHIQTTSHQIRAAQLKILTPNLSYGCVCCVSTARGE